MNPEIIRQYIEQQTCWICGKGGWISLSQHLALAHGLPAKEVREMAYMYKHERIVSEELSEIRSKLCLVNLGDKRHIFQKGYKQTKHILSTKYKDTLKKRVKEIQPLTLTTEALRKKRKPHYCKICGAFIETSQPKYCPECWRVAIGRATQKAMTPERIAQFKSVLYKSTAEERSRNSKEYWRKFKELPLEEQRKLSLEKAASRRVRVYKNCIICGAKFDVIPSQVDKIKTCRKNGCSIELYRRQRLGRKHTPEAIAKMSAHAKERHQREGGLFGRS